MDDKEQVRGLILSALCARDRVELMRLEEYMKTTERGEIAAREATNMAVALEAFCEQCLEDESKC